MKKTIWAVAVIVVIVLIVAIFSPSKVNNKDGTNLVIGADLTLTGGAALFGENIKNGMDLALASTTGIKIIYEDSKTTAVDGLAAYNRLRSQNVDLVISDFSIVSVPLSKVVLEQKVPLLVTMVSANASKIINDFTSRYFSAPNEYAEPGFISPISPLQKLDNIAVLYRNDEFGVAIFDEIKKLSEKYHKNIVYVEAFKPSETDFSTIMLKVKNSNADALVYVPAVPGESIAILKMVDQLKFDKPIIEASTPLSDLTVRAQVPKIKNLYSTSFDFVLPDHAVDFKNMYRSKYGREPNFAAAFGYDMIKLVNQCQNKKEDVLKCLNSFKELDGVAGLARQLSLGNFSVSLHLEKVN